MRQIKLYTLLFMFPFIISGCTDWLDGAIPKDQNLEESQYATEKGTNAVLNGIYRELSSETLYGGRLTMTGTELLANYHYYEENLLNKENMTFFNHMSTHKYGESDVMSYFSSIWSASYKTIFRINNFIANVAAANTVSEAKKNVLLGEAYALRAFIHLDLFRLFGDSVQTIPYNRSDEVIPHDPVASITEFFNLLLSDISQAKTLLQNDPVRTDGIKDFADLSNAEVSRIDAEEIFAEYMRNHRLNYFAVLALQARALAFQGKLQEAAQVAQTVLDEAFGEGKAFNWADKSKIIDLFGGRDYCFYSEILFGIYNMDLYSRSSAYVLGNQPGSTYTVYIDNLQNNIFGQDITDNDISLWEDIRAMQWLQSSIGGGQYVSIKFGHFASLMENNPKDYFQPLIRTGELHYIIAENMIQSGRISEAITYLNDFRFHRGVQYSSLPDPAVTTEETAYNILESEYYKEFYGEGQAFFYLKRRGSNKIFNPNRTGKKDISLESYLIPIPENELNN